ncbi:MAG: hypothetical protein IKH23_10955 [Clostridiales bacterium]|nr:hypothetical protein [Clostridiales bacterium]
MEWNTVQPIEEISDLKDAIETTVEVLKERLGSAPEGSLRAAKRPNGYQYYQMVEPHDTIGMYITRNNTILASQLAQKEYDSKLLAVLEKQLKSINRFLNTYNPDEVFKVFESLSDSRKLLVTPEYLTDEEYVKQWLSTPYRKLPFKADDPEYYTEKHERVRSKSEIIIANTLKSYNIPYRYECPVYEDEIPIGAPDFNCLNVRLRKEYYWEHLGMIGDEKYVNRNISKLEKYTMAKGFDESRLILTFESDKHPLNTLIVEEKIRKYLL